MTTDDLSRLRSYDNLTTRIWRDKRCTPGTRELAEVVWVLSPYRPAPSWWHPWRRIGVKAGWGRRNAEIGAEAGALADAGLLRCTENARWWWERKFEITDAGRAASEAAAVGVAEGAS